MNMIMKPNRIEKLVLLSNTKNTGVQIELNPRHEWQAEWNSRKKCWVLKRDVFQLVLKNEELINYFHPYYSDK